MPEPQVPRPKGLLQRGLDWLGSGKKKTEPTPEVPAEKLESGSRKIEDRTEFTVETPAGRVSASTHEGGERNKNADKRTGEPNNEDTVAVQVVALPDGSKRVQLLVVDGAGGSGDGKLAGILTRDKLLAALNTDVITTAALSSIIEQVSSEVKKEGKGGYACAVVIDIAPDQKVTIGFRGDTGVITFRGGEILPDGTTDADNRAQRAIEFGGTPSSEYYNHPYKSSILSAFGEGSGGPDAKEFIGQTGDIMVAFSDGAVRDLVSDYEVQQIVKKHLAAGDTEAIRKDVETLALARNNSIAPFQIEHAPGVFVDMAPQSGPDSDYAKTKKAEYDKYLSEGSISQEAYNEYIMYSQKGGDNISVLVSRLNFGPAIDEAPTTPTVDRGARVKKPIQIDDSLEAQQRRIQAEQAEAAAERAKLKGADKQVAEIEARMSPAEIAEFDKIPGHLRDIWLVALNGKLSAEAKCLVRSNAVLEGAITVANGKVEFADATKSTEITNQFHSVIEVAGSEPRYLLNAANTLTGETARTWQRLLGDGNGLNAKVNISDAEGWREGKVITDGSIVSFRVVEADGSQTIYNLNDVPAQSVKMEGRWTAAKEAIEESAVQAKEFVMNLLGKVTGARSERLKAAGVRFEDLPDQYQVKLSELDDVMRQKGERLIELRQALVDAERAVQDTWFYAGKERNDNLTAARQAYEQAREEFVAGNVKHYVAEQLAIGQERTTPREKGMIGRGWDYLGELNLDAAYTRGTGQELTGWKKVVARTLSVRTGASLALLGGAAFAAGGFGAIATAAEGSKMIAASVAARRTMGAMGGYFGTDNLLNGKSIDIAAGKVATILEKKKKMKPGKRFTDATIADLGSAVTYMASASAIEGRSLLQNQQYLEAVQTLTEHYGSGDLTTLSTHMDRALEDTRKIAKAARGGRKLFATLVGAMIGTGEFQRAVGKMVGWTAEGVNAVSKGVAGIDLGAAVSSAYEGTMNFVYSYTPDMPNMPSLFGTEDHPDLATLPETAQDKWRDIFNGQNEVAGKATFPVPDVSGAPTTNVAEYNGSFVIQDGKVYFTEPSGMITDVTDADLEKIHAISEAAPLPPEEAAIRTAVTDVQFAQNKVIELIDANSNPQEIAAAQTDLTTKVAEFYNTSGEENLHALSENAQQQVSLIRADLDAAMAASNPDQQLIEGLREQYYNQIQAVSELQAAEDRFIASLPPEEVGEGRPVVADGSTPQPAEAPPTASAPAANPETPPTPAATGTPTSPTEPGKPVTAPATPAEQPVRTPGAPVSEATDAAPGTGTGRTIEGFKALIDANKDMYLVHSGEGISNPMYRQLFASAREFGFQGKLPENISDLRALEGTPWKEWADKIVTKTLKETTMVVDGKSVSLFDAAKDQNVWVMIKDKIGVVFESHGGKPTLTIIDTSTNSVMVGEVAPSAGVNASASSVEAARNAAFENRTATGEALGGVASQAGETASTVAGGAAKAGTEAVVSGGTGTPTATGAAAESKPGGGGGGATDAAASSAASKSAEQAATAGAETSPVTVATDKIDFDKTYGRFVPGVKSEMQRIGGDKWQQVTLKQNGLEISTNGRVMYIKPEGVVLPPVEITKPVLDALRDVMPANANEAVTQAQFTAAIEAARAAE